MVALMFKLNSLTNKRNRPVTYSTSPDSFSVEKQPSQLSQNQPKLDDRFLHESTLDVDNDGLPLWLGTDRKIYSGFCKSGKAIIWSESLDGIESTSFSSTRNPFCYLRFGDFDPFYTKTQRAIEGARRVQRAASTRINLLDPAHPQRQQWQQWIMDAATVIKALSGDM
jgi:hypothetical protein